MTPAIPPASSLPRAQAHWHRVTLGTSVQNRPIDAVFFGPGPYETFIFAGIHGSERISADLADRLIALLQSDPSPIGGRSIIILPRANPDGLAINRRPNANRIDLNRNFPASNFRRSSPNSAAYGGITAASEPETRVIMGLLSAYAPRRVVSIHAMHGQPCNNFDGPAEHLARLMSRHNGYRILPNMGYPTPGSFGTYCGIDRGIPTITLELPTRGSIDTEWPGNRDALLALIRASD